METQEQLDRANTWFRDSGFLETHFWETNHIWRLYNRLVGVYMLGAFATKDEAVLWAFRHFGAVESGRFSLARSYAALKSRRTIRM